jgi:hypothetical protein
MLSADIRRNDDHARFRRRALDQRDQTEKMRPWSGLRAGDEKSGRLRHSGRGGPSEKNGEKQERCA